MKKIFILILTLFVLFQNSLFSYSGQYICQQVPEKGTILSTVNCIYRETNSQVWIGTHKGLYCYNGDRLQQFSHSEDSLSLPGNFIYEMSIDIQGNFWILTNEGITQYNKLKNEFHLVTNKKKGQKTIAYSYCQTEKGVFFGGTNAIYHWNYLTRQFTCFKKLSCNTPLIIQHIQVLSPNKLLCTSRDKGIFILDINNKTWIEAPFKCSKEISSVFIDKQQRIWVAEYNHGLHCYNANGQELAFYHRTNSALNNNIILCLAEQDSLIWIGTDGGGINILNPKTGHIENLTYCQTENYFLPVNSIKCFYKDSNHSMWAGSIRNGVINIKKSLIKTYTDMGKNSKAGLSNPTVLCLFNDKNTSDIWIGTDGEGINKLDTKTNEFTHFHKGQQAKVASIAAYQDNKLLLSLYSKGLFVFDKKNGNMTELPINNPEVNEQIRYTQKTINLYNETPHSILLLNQHIYRYNLLNQHTEKIISADSKPTNGLFLPIGFDKGKIILHDSYTIYKLIPQSNKVERLFRMPQGIAINSGTLDSQGNIWLATNTGIYCYHILEGKLLTYPTSLFREANSILCDNQKRVWIGANNRLYVYITPEKRFAMLSESDGAIQNEYLEKPKLLTAQGDIYMGGIKGLLYINHQFAIDTSDKPVIKLTDIHIDGNKIPADRLNNSTTLTFPWGSKALDLWVTSFEQDLFRPRIYRFSINGISQQQFDTHNPQITLRLLPPGHHDVYVSCNTRSGEWTEPTLILSIDALPPWYQAGWFILLITILLATTIIIIFITMLRRKENKLKFAMKEREKDIYEEKVRFLINISHELRTPLTLIHAPLKRILKKLPTEDGNYATLSQIYRQSGRMKEMLDMVLDLRKMEVKQQKLQIKSYQLNQWIEETVNDFIAEGEAMDIQIKTELDPSITLVNFDKKKCDIILTNLLVNALKHSPQGSSIRIVSTYIQPDRIRISVSDQGFGLQGIDPEQLFTRFYQGSEEKSGTGIGLSYSKILVELQGGKIGAQNNEGPGATFFFELPLNLMENTTPDTSRPYLNELLTSIEHDIDTTATTCFNTQYASLLIVEDNAELLHFLQEALADYFGNIHIAQNGKEALKIMGKHLPDIIVSDVMMPLMNGYELCQYVKGNLDYSHIPIILLTARNEEQSQQLGYKLGADAFLPKPFEVDTLLEILRNKLKQRDEIKKRYAQTALLPEPLNTTFSMADENFLLKLNKIINEHLNNPDLGVPFICQEIGFSRTSLYNKLKAITGMGLNDYINKIKMEKAVNLIKTTNLSFSEIADQTGFSTARYFSTTFKQYTGQTPSQYREEWLALQKGKN